MYTDRNRGSFKKFLERRDYLLFQFRQGDLNKREFIEANLDIIYGMNLKPFNKIDNFEKGVYTYQYYNIMAKHTRLLAREEFIKGKHMTEYKNLIKKADEYYWLKDKTTYNLLRYLEFKDVTAYNIKVKSKFLKDRLFEIVIEKPEFIILHSKNGWLKQKLIEEGVFAEKSHISLADNYVNQKY